MLLHSSIADNTAVFNYCWHVNFCWRCCTLRCHKLILQWQKMTAVQNAPAQHQRRIKCHSYTIGNWCTCMVLNDVPNLSKCVYILWKMIGTAIAERGGNSVCSLRWHPCTINSNSVCSSSTRIISPMHNKHMKYWSPVFIPETKWQLRCTCKGAAVLCRIQQFIGCRTMLKMTLHNGIQQQKVRWSTLRVTQSHHPIWHAYIILLGTSWVDWLSKGMV